MHCSPLPSRARSHWAVLVLLVLFGLAACSTAPPAGMTAVTPFDLARYEGKWYELARLDHSFERGLTNVSATYRAQPDGSVRVTNRGYDPARREWREAVGRALFTGSPERASLKVSFFGPFYGGYHVLALDQQGYRWAMVVGADRDYLWILARDRQLPAVVREQLLSQARKQGFAVDKLIWVEQTHNDG
ncbi:lipocalin family protein [Accumulibacter sp.]|uniref:lipocalin family protein n=1 Tax=Accumulibacter sp. TaxID=2053492 RepID=UPI001E17F915|nr:lipocalin family protein [Accumulibacter sp.]MCB1965151.1 lipocalin family protein [Accumulibacter sp.]MCP5227234.1 lipocalin family protein [Accumulibacter sp.]